MRSKKKRRLTKKTPSIVESEPNKTKSDSTDQLGSKISNINSIVRLISKLSNTVSKVSLGSGNEEGEESGNELIERMKTGMIYGALIGLFCISSYLSTSFKMVNTIIQKLTNINLSVDFETIS